VNGKSMLYQFSKNIFVTPQQLEIWPERA